MRKTPSLLTAAVLTGLVTACGSIDSTGTSTGSEVATSTGSSASARHARIGQTVRDGKFAFTVTGVKRGVSRVGNEMLGKSAQGEFVLVNVTVKNIGTEPQGLSDTAQKLFDTARRQYSADSEAAIYANERNQVLYNEINPGNTVKGVLIFDVPPDTKLSHLELHDSMFSGGVRVDVK